MSGPAFQYTRAAGLEEAIETGVVAGSAFLAGGTDLLPLWKAEAESPEMIVDISRLPLAEVSADEEGLTLGALARLSSVARHEAVARDYPLIAQALAASASGQIRNMATVAGNLLQRTRCAYFRSGIPACNKRRPGSGCGALSGENRQHALFGGSEACVATHPSDLAVALAALDAIVCTEGPAGERWLRLAELYRLPDQDPARDTVLAHGELVTGVEVPDGRRFARRSIYLKVRDRASFEFAVVSVAAAVHVEGGRIVEARLAAGGVAPKPWRLTASEAALKDRAPTRSSFEAAAALAVQGARPLAHNGFKVELLRRTVLRALESLGGAA